MHKAIRGALAGTLATILMSVPIFTAQQLGLFLTAPPVAISRTVTRKTSLLPNPGTPSFSVVEPVAHLAYGAISGTVFSLVRPVLPESSYKAGLLFGGAVWAASYAGYLPAINLYPAPVDDKKSRVSTMLLAHADYGSTLAVLSDKDWL